MLTFYNYSYGGVFRRGRFNMECDVLVAGIKAQIRKLLL